MVVVKVSLVWVVLNFLWTLTRGDAEVYCGFNESCILPCSFTPGNNAVVHWILVRAKNPSVHSFYYNTDQLAPQDQRYRGRTSLFKDQISRGNASLQLTGAKLQDQGRYKCYTSTLSGNQELFINLKVEAPVGKVDLQQVGNKITCSSEGIYPQPELTWSTSPPSTVTFKNQAEVQETEQLLYNIRSSLTVSDSDSDLSYSCSISTRRNKRRATLFKTSSVSRSSSATLHCTSSNTSLTGFSLTWRFNHSQIVLTQTRADVSSSVSEGWSQQVKGVSESGSLMLQNLSPHHEGIYTCELSDAEETLITNTFLRIQSPDEDSTNHGVIIGLVVAAVLVSAAVVLVWCCKRKRGEQRNRERESNIDQTPTELEPMNAARDDTSPSGSSKNVSQINGDTTRESNNDEIQIATEATEGTNEETPRQNGENLTPPSA